MNKAVHVYDGHFWIGFVNNIEKTGEWIEAADMKSAKYIFAVKHGVPVSGYITGKKKGFKPL